MRAVLSAVLLLLTAGCVRPNYSPMILPQHTALFGCNAQETLARSDSLYAGKPRGFRYTPAVGTDACTLFARIGTPQDVRTVRTADLEAQHLYYRSTLAAKQSGLVVLRRDDRGTWRVASVVWDSPAGAGAR